MFPVTDDYLTSFHYFATNAGIIRDLHAAGARVIGDSGAYSAASLGKPINIDAYAEWVESNGRYLCWAASLDAIGDPAQSWNNWRYLTRHGVDTVPTVHYGAEGRDLDRYADEGATLVGLGGVAARKDRPNVLRWLVHMFRHARANHPDMRFHGWGLTSKLYLDHLPFYSVDSSGFGSSYRYARASLFNPDTGRNVGFALNGRESQKHTGLLRKHYGVGPRDVAVSDSGNRNLLANLGARSARLMSDYYTARHHVTPPRPGWPTGTRIHYAEANPGALRANLPHIEPRP